MLALIRAHALLHQAARERDENGAVIAAPDDYTVVREIVEKLIGEAAERTIPQTVRETVAKVNELASSDDELSLPEIATALGLDKSATSRRVRVAIDRGYLKNLEEKRGRPSRIVAGDPLPEDVEILPTAEVLQRCSASAEGDQEADDGYSPSAFDVGDEAAPDAPA